MREMKYSVHKGHNSGDDNLCKSDVQVDIYLTLLLIKSNPVVFLLIPKDQPACSFKSSVRGIFVSCYLFIIISSLKGHSHLKVHQTLCAIWYHLQNSTNVKHTHAGFTESNTPPWVFFTFLKLYKWHPIEQHITLKINRK